MDGSCTEGSVLWQEKVRLTVCLSIQEAERVGQQIKVLLRVCPRDLKTSLKAPFLSELVIIATVFRRRSLNQNNQHRLKAGVKLVQNMKRKKDQVLGGQQR